MEQPLLSVAVAVYKTEAFFKRCLDSLFASEYKNLEILLIDDGSPDNCPALCDEYAKKDDRIKVVHKENGGGFSAKNLAIDIAKGKYFAICDNDDMVPPDAYRKMIEKAMETDADVVQGVVRRTNVNSNDVKLWKRSETDDIKTKSIGFQGAIYRTEMLQKNNIKLGHYRLGDDMCFMVQVLNYADKVVYIDDVTYEYLIRPTTSNEKSAIQMKDFLHYYDEFRWRCWALEYIVKSPKLMEQYGDRLGTYCPIIDETWLTFTVEEREKCFEKLQHIVACINWERDSQNPKGYLKVDVSKFQKMTEAAYTKAIRREYKYIQPVRKLIRWGR